MSVQEFNFSMTDSFSQCSGVSNRKYSSLLAVLGGTKIAKDILNFRQDSVITCLLDCSCTIT